MNKTKSRNATSMGKHTSNGFVSCYVRPLDTAPKQAPKIDWFDWVFSFTMLALVLIIVSFI